MTRAAFLLVVVACANQLPETRYYQLAPSSGSAAHGFGVLVLEPFETDTAYDDERIVYRTNPYRLDYYQYHRWSAAPGVLVADFLEQALEHAGRFRAVVREPTADAALALRGRVVAIEEVDRSRTQWIGRIVLELVVVDARTGEVVWREQLEEHEPMALQHPEGLARALSIALDRISARLAPVIGDLADHRAAATTSPTPATLPARATARRAR